jgi:AhpD family alkylhydroperoxidase
MTTSILPRTLTLFIALLLSLISGTAAAQSTAPDQRLDSDARAARSDIEKTIGFVPGFFRVTSDAALPGVWSEMKGLQLNPGSALTGRTKELIGLAVSAQVPCRYCVYAHTEFAKLNGATEADLAEAVAVGGLERHSSAYLFGSQIDENELRSDVSRMVVAAKKPAVARPTIVVVDFKTARADIEQTFGFVPALLRAMPEGALPGAWREMKGLKLSATSLSSKEKSLIGLAVASQVPSRPCVIAETEFAKLAGATEREIAEAVGMAAITRNMSTLLNGQQIDERGFRADVDRLVAGAKAAQRKSARR